MKTTTMIVYSGLATLVLAYFALSPQARATCHDGCLTNSNTVLGEDALFSLDGGSSNTGIGAVALHNNIIGTFNTAVGDHALSTNTASFNTATGSYALVNNTTGNHNTANGNAALDGNNTGSFNTATGSAALNYNTIGYDNTADGVFALHVNTSGNYNTANGYFALGSNTTGNYNTANGSAALLSNTTGSLNVAIGTNAGRALTTGSGNVCIGVNVYGVAGESNTTRIRNVYSSVTSGRAVYVTSGNKIGTLASSRRFKEEIKAMEKASESILGLRPVTFRYKKEIEANGTKQFGLVAEEVEKVNPDLVTCDEEGKPQSVRYEAINAMLLNEFLKEHRKVQEQESTIAQLKSTVMQQQKGMEIFAATLNEQASQIQKVSAQVEASKFAGGTAGRIRRGGAAPRQLVINNP
jgi:hypothetical protein